MIWAIAQIAQLSRDVWSATDPYKVIVITNPSTNNQHFARIDTGTEGEREFRLKIGVLLLQFWLEHAKKAPVYLQGRLNCRGVLIVTDEGSHNTVAVETSDLSTMVSHHT